MILSFFINLLIFANSPPITPKDSRRADKVMIAASRVNWSRVDEKFKKQEYQDKPVQFEIVSDLVRAWSPDPWRTYLIIKCCDIWNRWRDPVAAKIEFWRYHFQLGQADQLNVLKNTNFFGYNYSTQTYTIADMYQRFISAGDMDGVEWLERYVDSNGIISVLCTAFDQRPTFFDEHFKTLSAHDRRVLMNHLASPDKITEKAYDFLKAHRDELSEYGKTLLSKHHTAPRKYRVEPVCVCPAGVSLGREQEGKNPLACWMRGQQIPESKGGFSPVSREEGVVLPGMIGDFN